ncbi:DMT family transporter [Tianweitania sediminis]|uniref:DMT family transporter n=1 Tax=Tianweitania sediminis TaxID=1502156 RepID=A0A8J7UGD2_9HYPH|nr:DMT family transporter [Tianweitania sediminis]
MIGSRGIGYACLVATAIGWGLNWPWMKILLQEWPPLFSRGLAGTIAAALLALVAVKRGERLAIARPTLPSLLFGSFTNVFAWMGFSTVAMQWLTVSEASLVVYTMPLWTTLLAWLLVGAKPTARELLGLGLGFLGIGVLLGGQGLAVGTDKLLGYGLAVGAAVLFALGSVLRPRGDVIPPFTLVAWQVGVACSVMMLIGIVFEGPDLTQLSFAGGLAMGYMTVIAMGLCYLTWFETRRRLPASTAATGMLLVPIVGIVAAAAMLGEHLGPRETLAMGLTLGGVALAVAR